MAFGVLLFRVLSVWWPLVCFFVVIFSSNVKQCQGEYSCGLWCASFIVNPQRPYFLYVVILMYNSLNKKWHFLVLLIEYTCTEFHFAWIHNSILFKLTYTTDSYIILTKYLVLLIFKYLSKKTFLVWHFHQIFYSDFPFKILPVNNVL